MQTIILKFFLFSSARIGLLLAISLFSILYSSSTFSSARFEKLSIKDGLPGQTVWDTTQDKEGAIWFATTHGLSRYDGNEIKTYVSDPDDSYSLSNNIVNSLLVTRQGDLWVGTYKGGLNLFDFNTQKFKSYQHDISKTDSLSSNNITALAEAKNGDIWIATDSGLNKFNQKEQLVEKISPEVLSNSTLQKKNITALSQSNNGSLWVGTSSGVSYYSLETREFTSHQLPIKTQPKIRAFQELANGNMLIATEKGLFHFDNDTYQSKLITSVPQQGVLSLTLDLNNDIWIGTRDYGAFLIDAQDIHSTSPKAFFRYDRGTSYSLSDNVILDLFTDKTGVVWLGTFSAGVNTIDPETLKFGFQDDSNNGISCLPSPIIYSFFEDHDDTLWIGTRLGLVHILGDGTCSVFKHSNENIHSPSDNEIHKIYRDSAGVLWIGTAKGLDRYIQKNNSFQRITQSFPAIRIYDIAEANDYRLIVGTANGLFIEGENNSFSKIKNNAKELDSMIISKLQKFTDEKYLVATTKGLLELNTNDNSIDYYSNSLGIKLKGAIRAFFVDSKNNIWAGIDGEELVKLSPTSLTRYGRHAGLPKINVYSSIVEDSHGLLWISTGSNLIRFDPNRLKAKVFISKDGLQGEVFVRRAHALTNSGDLIFGGLNGINVFSPRKIKDNPYPAKIIINKFYYFGEEYSNNNKPKEFRLPSPISQLEQLNLTHKDYNFGFEFSALHFSDYSRNHYAYMMDGFDPDWLYTDSSNRKVNYTNLPAGNYIFKVKASNKDGIWNETPKELKITISPAPWKTWWAYTIYAITLFLSLLYFIKKRTQILEERAQQLENTVEQRTQELSQEKQKVEQLLSKKNEEFANVSHEFRTPLTLVLGPVAQLIEKANDEASINKLNIIQRNGYRLLRMVDQLLNIETFRIKTITKKSPQAIGKNTKLMCEAFSDLADANDMKLNFVGEENINFEFTQDAYEKILLNLLSNAIKYSKPGAIIKVITERTKDNEYHLVVSDTGIGIPTDKLDSVFERYNRVMDENSEQVTGAGIGLALVKELVEAHQGRVQLQSELGKGTQIDIYLPIINEVSGEDVATGSNADLIDIELVSLSNQKASGLDSSETEVEGARKESTVLVIEDNADMRQYISNSLQDQYKVLTANNGKAGVELAIEEVPDVIVSDIMMPVMDGYEATKAIRDNEITSHIPLVLLTARGDRESRLRGWNEKADEYLTKPFDVEELKIRLANLLEIRNLLKKKFAETVFVEEKTIEQDSTGEDQSDIYSNKRKQQQIFIGKLNNFLQDNYSDHELAVPQISKAILMSERQFFRKLKSILDLSPVEYLRRYRLEKGKELLGQGFSTNRTAFDVGFTSQGYFGRCFKAQYGVSPSEYKKQLQSKT